MRLEDLDAGPVDGSPVLHEVPAPNSKPPIEIGSGPQTIRALTEAINARELPETYVSNGRVVHVETVSGSAAAVAGDDDSPLPVTAARSGPPHWPGCSPITPSPTGPRPGRTSNGKPETYAEEATPGAQSLTAALARNTWPGLHPLHGIVGAPVLRPDGTLLQEPGIRRSDRVYLASKIPLDMVPAAPTAEQVARPRGRSCWRSSCTTSRGLTTPTWPTTSACSSPRSCAVPAHR